MICPMADKAERNIVQHEMIWVWFRRGIQYFRVGKLLHLMSALGVAAFFQSGQYALTKFNDTLVWSGLGYGYISIYGLVLIGFSQMDAWCRYQNYKMVKDLFFENQDSRQQKKRIADIFSVSKCQREAVKVAAKDLGWIRELSEHYKQSGYRWYHLIPDRVIEKPKVLFTRVYWKKTLFVRYYSSKHFLW